MKAFSNKQLKQSPVSIHLLINDKCNLDCSKCFYENNGTNHVETNKILSLFKEWEGKVSSVAIGGGEPMLHPGIETIVDEGKKHGFHVAITTNGTVKKNVSPNRVHVSHDNVHDTDKQQVKEALEHYSGKADNIGINHVVTSIDKVKQLSKFNCDTVTLIKEKPETNFSKWGELTRVNLPQKVWMDACVAMEHKNVNCRQGFASMSLNQELEASPCSNLDINIPYTSLKETWKKVRNNNPCSYAMST